jgi:endonuclease YncB( thermonuclease family)
MDIDKYHCMVGVIWIDNGNINLEMVQEGYAEAYLAYLREPYRAKLIQGGEESESRKERNLVVTRI